MILPTCLRAATLWFCLASIGAAAAKLEVRFLAERLPDGLEDVVMAAEEASSDPFQIPTTHLSEPQAAPTRAFQLRSAGELRPLGSVTLPGEGTRFAVLLLPAPEGRFRSIVLRTDQPGFRPGDNYLLNNSDRPIVGYIGTARFRLVPGEGRVVRPAGPTDEGFHQVGFGIEEEAGTRSLSMTRWPVDSALRSYIFFFKNSRTGRIDYRAVDEFVPPAPEPE